MSKEVSARLTSYQPHIDGLRAIAILSVLFYHAGLGCPGGYVGVDVFFVISGYLITSLILKDLNDDKFSIVRFWERRLRRIFPALAATVLVTLVASWFLLLPDDLVKLGKSTVAQTLLSANFYFWRTDNYFGGANADKPLLHTWSLAVEEQFYLFLPLILIFLFRRAEFRRPRVLLATLLAGFAVSLGIAVWGVKHQPYATFFLLPTRAWELICGAMVAVLPATAVPATRLVREGASWLGLLGIFLPVCLYNDSTPFPGLAALPPCLGTALLIWANANGQRKTTADNDHGPRTTLKTLLSVRPVVFIGLISYSLYLWHWPVLSFSNYWKTAPFTPVMCWTLVGVSFIVAVLSWRYVETPFRNRSLCASRPKIFGLAGASTATICLAGLCFTILHGIPARLPQDARAIIKASDDDEMAMAKFDCLIKPLHNAIEVNDKGLPRFGSTNSSAPVTVMVWGDSHAGRAIPVFDELCKRTGISGRSAVVDSTPPLVNLDYHSKFSCQDPIQLSEAIVDYIKEHHIQNTFLVARWAEYEHAMGPAKLENAVKATIKVLETAHTKVWVLLDVPDYDCDITRTYLRGIMFPFFSWHPATCSLERHHDSNIAMYNLSTHVVSATFLDPAPYLLDPKKRNYMFIENNCPLYVDSNHLTLRGAETAILPLLDPVFAKCLSEKTE